MENIEVTITLEDEQYKAVCPTFPKCVGVGPSKQEALVQLSQSISRSISQSANEAMKAILLSDNYTEILIDPASEKQEERLVFTLDPLADTPQKTLFFKLSPTPELSPMVPFPEDDVRMLFQPPSASEQPSVLNQLASLLGKVPPQGSQEGFLFGVPFSIN